MFVIWHNKGQDAYLCHTNFPRIYLCYLSSNLPDKWNLTFCGTVFLLTVYILLVSCNETALLDSVQAAIFTKKCLYHALSDSSTGKKAERRSQWVGPWLSATPQLTLFISKNPLNFENSGELWRTLENSGVLKVQRFFADVGQHTPHPANRLSCYFRPLLYVIQFTYYHYL